MGPISPATDERFTIRPYPRNPHLPGRCLRAVERAGQVHRYLATPILGGDLQERGPLLHTRVVHQDVKAPQLADDLPDGSRDGIELADVGDLHHGPAAEASDLSSCRLGGHRIDVNETDVGSFASEPQCDRFADPSPARGDDANLTVEDHLHLPSEDAKAPV